MKRLWLNVIIVVMATGCAMPDYSRPDNIDCISRTNEWYRTSLFGAYESRAVILDAKNRRVTDEELSDLNNSVEEYISNHPEVTQEIKVALRNLSVVKGMTRDQVNLLLGEPERIQSINLQNKFQANERWVYIIQGLTSVQVGPVPIFLTHDAYHLYFDGDVLSMIESVRMETL